MNAVVVKLPARRWHPDCGHHQRHAAHPTTIFNLESQPTCTSRSNTGANRLDGNSSDVLSSLLVVHVAWSSSRNWHLRHGGVGSQSSKLFHEFLVEHLDTF